MIAQTVIGKVVDPAGKGISDLQVAVFVENPQLSTQTDNYGDFRLENVSGLGDDKSIPEDYSVSNNYPASQMRDFMILKGEK